MGFAWDLLRTCIGFAAKQKNHLIWGDSLCYIAHSFVASLSLRLNLLKVITFQRGCGKPYLDSCSTIAWFQDIPLVSQPLL